MYDKSELINLTDHIDYKSFKDSLITLLNKKITEEKEKEKEKMENKFIEQDRYERAKKRVKDIKGFYTHALVYVVINIMIFIYI